VRGKYLERVREGINVELIAPDMVGAFRDSESVNEALRRLKSVGIGW